MRYVAGGKAVKSSAASTSVMKAVPRALFREILAQIRQLRFLTISAVPG
jgi:hypothetical protein